MIRVTQMGAAQAERVLASINAKQRRASARALNKVAVTARKRGVKAISGQVRLSANYVRDHLRITHARPDYLEARIIAAHRPVLLTRYGARIVTQRVKYPAQSVGDLSRGIAPGRKAAGVSVAVSRASGRKRMKRAFFIWLRGGNWGVALRTGLGKKDYAVKYGPSVDQLFRRVKDEQAPEVLVDYVRTFERELRYEMQR